VDERQSLETLTREVKTSGRALTQLTEREQGFQEKKSTRSEELTSQNEKRQELEERISTLQTELAAARQELENQQSERARISKLQVEVDEKLQNIYHQLLQAGVERQESEKETKMKETIANLQRIFPGR
jgi:structural maintenance of chromosome 1